MPHTESPASFLNLDLELESDRDLAPLAEHLSGQVFVLYCGNCDDGFRLSIEPVIASALSQDPSACTEHFLRLVATLPPELLSLWRGCMSRVFDYGFDGGLEANPFKTILSSSQLGRIAALGADIRVTVYPFREHSFDEEPQTSQGS